MSKAYKNYFPLPNVIFSLGLSPGEIAVYSYLLYCEDRKTYQCHPSYKTIGQAVGMSVTQFKSTLPRSVKGASSASNLPASSLNLVKSVTAHYAIPSAPFGRLWNFITSDNSIN